MSDPTLALQKAVYDTLTGADFQGACGLAVGVYDHIPQNASAPYVVISNIQTDGAQVDRYDGTTAHLNLQVWSTKPGKVELFTIAAAARSALAPRSDLGPPFSLTGHRLITWRHLQTVPMDDPDGISVKATVTIEYLTEPL